MLAKQIHSLQHPIVKQLVNLRKNATDREEKQEVVIVGKKLLLELNEKFSFKKVLFSTEKPKLKAEEYFSVADPVLKKISGLQSYTDGVIGTLALPKERDLSKKTYLLGIDRIADPGNLGTLFRSAWALGFEGVFLLTNTVDLFNEKVIRAAKGANFYLPFARISQKELVSWIEKKNRSFYLAHMQGEPISSVRPKTPLCLLLSSEAHGADPLLRQHISTIQIPMFEKAESLNVAVAGGILMQHLRSFHG